MAQENPRRLVGDAGGGLFRQEMRRVKRLLVNLPTWFNHEQVNDKDA